MDALPLKHFNLVMKTENPAKKIKFQWSIRNIHKLPEMIRSSKFALASGQPLDWDVSIRRDSEDKFEFHLTYHAQRDAVPIQVSSSSRVLKNAVSLLVSDTQSFHQFNGGDQHLLLDGVQFPKKSEDDKLVFQCSMTSHGYGLVCSRNLYNDQEVEEELGNDYLSMMQSEEFADVRVLVESRCFAAHRCVLKSLVPKFFSDHQEKILGGKIRLYKILPGVFEAVLQSVYSGKVDQTAIANYLEQIYEVAFQNDLGGLLRASHKEMIYSVNMINLFTLYDLAEHNEDEKLVEYCRAFLKDNQPKLQSDKPQGRTYRKRPKATLKKLVLLRNHFN